MTEAVFLMDQEGFMYNPLISIWALMTQSEQMIFATS